MVLLKKIKVVETFLDFGKNRRILPWIVFLPVLGIILTTILLVGIYVKYENVQYSETILKIQKNFLRGSRNKAKERVDRIVDFLHTNKKIIYSAEKEEIKNIVYLAREIVKNIYFENRNLPKKVILKKIKDRLRHIRFFDDLSGYFFIYDFQGKGILLPANPELEGTSLCNLQDVKGTYIVRKMIEIAKKNLEGYISWYWRKPNEENIKKKYGYISLFEPLGIVIGSGRYDEDILKNIKKETKLFLDNLSYPDGSNLFVYSGTGVLLSQEKTKSIFEDKKEELNAILEKAKNEKEGFFVDEIVNNPSGKNNSVFVRYVKGMNWLIGINTYGQVLENIVLKKKESLQKELHNTVKNFICISLPIVVIILIIMLVISRKLKKILKYYQNSILLKHKKTLAQKKLLQHQIKHDILTSLPNRLLLEDRLEQLIKRADREGHKIAVLFVDVDKFKFINDTYGHQIGDLLLKKVAKRLKRTTRSSDIVARLSGDEFIVVIDECKDIHSVVSVLNKFQENFSKEFVLESTEHKIHLSIGVSLYPDDGKEVKELLKYADSAMLKVKEEGRDNYKFYTSQMNQEVQHQLEIERELQEAIKNKEFELHYQPIINSKSLLVEGFEALIRWNHPTKGLIYPNSFIEIAEESNLIVQIGEWVSKEAMKQTSIWYEMGLKPGRVSINFASRQLAKDDLYDFIIEALEETNCKPEWIGIEIVERVIMKNPEKTIQLLKQLRDINVGISIDDFGTGFSSLSYLKELPITKIKIDKAFVDNLETSFEDRAIAKTILALGKGLYLKVLAEGVETQKQKEFLVENGCIQMQGYLFSRPLNVTNATELLKKQKDLLQSKE
jgi:diguanylate cyclase (GGDEF)-like protein